ncbi:MAG: hypothetical protein EXR67_03945 [Dehalococcoidia bacterium]|nr:hypothetical protein [Dehalococcoidia bacterium]
MFKLPDGRVVIPRTEMTYPGISRDVLTNKDADPLRMSRSAADAQRSPVDHVMADMEDACPFPLKGEPVRKAIAQAFTTLDFGHKVVTWRPNNVRSGLFEADVDYMMKHAVDRFHGIVLPKSFAVGDVEYAANVVKFTERLYGWKHAVQLEALIETPSALEQVDGIAAVLERSGRGAGLIFGIADFASFLGIGNIIADQHIKFAYAKQRTVIAAKAHGLHAIDNVFLRLPRRTDSPEVLAQIDKDLRAKNTWSASFGMDGTWVVHPAQALISNECYTPTDDEVKAYKSQLERSLTSGGGAIADPDTGEMIDDATLRIALQCLSKAAQANKITWDEVRKMNSKITEITGYDILGLESIKHG